MGAYNLWGQGLYNLDLGIKRTFKIYREWNFQLEADLLNATNHTVFGNPSVTVTGAPYTNGTGGGVGISGSGLVKSAVVRLTQRAMSNSPLVSTFSVEGGGYPVATPSLLP